MSEDWRSRYKTYDPVIQALVDSSEFTFTNKHGGLWYPGWSPVPDPDEPPPQFPDPIPNIMPFGTVTLLAGAPGVGKTAMVAGFVRRWLDGKSIWGHRTNPPTEFCYLAADRQWASHQQWFDAVGYSQIKHYSIADDRTINLEWLKNPQNAAKCFENSLKQLDPKPGAHVFVDPMAPLFISGDQNRTRDVAITLLQFSRICSQRQINLTCCAHFSKQKTDAQTQYRRPMDRISGSGALVGFSDTQIYLIDPEPPEQPYHIFGWRPRHAREETFKVLRNDSGLFIPYNEDTGEITLLLELIPTNQSISVKDLEELAFEGIGMSRRTLFRRLADLKEAGKVEHENGRVAKRRLH